MAQKISTPKDLGNLVFKKLKGANIESPLPKIEVLNNLFDILFYTSIKTEEGQFIKVTITLIDPNNPDPSPPKDITADRWNYIYFEKRIPFTVKNLVKLSKAADPWSSSLAVYYDINNDLTIWGMIDQSIHYQSFLNYESNEVPEQPGLFQTTIIGLGSLVVIFDFELIATLKQNVLISNYIDVFKIGPVNEILSSYSNRRKSFIETYINKKFPDEDIMFWKEFVQSLINDSLSRILLRIQNYQHGGALLITSNIKSDLDIKYEISYNRLSKSITNLVKLTIANAHYYNEVEDFFIEPEEENLPIVLYMDEKDSENGKKKTTDELKGAIRFISSLSCIDGLVVVSPDLKVNGFGTIIKLKDLPEQVYTSKTSKVNDERLSSFSPNHFGTRHCSMFSFCWNNIGSLGFVVSQDGDIRAIMRVNDKLIMWENIKVQQFKRSKKLIRPLIIRKMKLPSREGK